MEAWPLVVENFRCKGGHADLTVTCKLCLGFVGLLFENRNLKKKKFYEKQNERKVSSETNTSFKKTFTTNLQIYIYLHSILNKIYCNKINLLKINLLKINY